MKTNHFFSVLFLFSLLSVTSVKAQMGAEQIKQITKESYAAIANHDLDKFATYIADSECNVSSCSFLGVDEKTVVPDCHRS